MTAVKRSIDSVYDEIAGLTGNRAELERRRYVLVKALRAVGAVLADSGIIITDDDPLRRELEDCAIALQARKSLLWIDIEKTDNAIQLLTDLAQNGAYDNESH